MRPALLALIALASACAPKVARFPGPLRSIGEVERRFPPPDAPVVTRKPTQAVAERAPRRRGDDVGVEIARAAEHYLEHAPRGFRDDCSGFVSASLARAGVDVQGSSKNMWDLAVESGVAHRRKLPDVGDIAFYDDTWDRNGDGKRNDELTHVAVVVDVARDGTILLAHAGTSKGRTTMLMNLKHPGDRRDEIGEPINDILRRKETDDPNGEYLSGELWRGFATFGGDERAVAESGE